MVRLPLVSPLERMLFLKAQPYLEGIPSEVLAALASYSEEGSYSRRTRIPRGDRSVERILFLAEGRVRVGDVGDGDREPISVEAPGVVGLAHHFAEATPAPAVVAEDPVLCLELAVIDLDQILEDHFPLLLQFARRSGSEVMNARRAIPGDRPDEPGFEASDRVQTPVRLDLVQRLARARRAPFFKGTNLTVLGQMIRFEKPRTLEAGDALWQVGEPIDELALVLDGTLRSAGPFAPGRAGAGATLGAFEILSEGKREEGWVAESVARIVPISRELFIDLLEDHYEFARLYLKRQARALISAWERLSERAPRAAEKDGRAAILDFRV